MFAQRGCVFVLAVVIGFLGFRPFVARGGLVAISYAGWVPRIFDWPSPVAESREPCAGCGLRALAE
eukprot:3149338-Pyramimonas_sp.AAC.1